MTIQYTVLEGVQVHLLCGFRVDGKPILTYATYAELAHSRLDVAVYHVLPIRHPSIPAPPFAPRSCWTHSSGMTFVGKNPHIPHNITTENRCERLHPTSSWAAGDSVTFDGRWPDVVSRNVPPGTPNGDCV